MASRSPLKDLLVPHTGNGYHPKLFKRTAVIALLAAILLFEGAYVIDTEIAQDDTSFLASVLPGALLGLTNADREDNGVAPLVNDPLLAKAAQLKANDMAAKGYFAHTSPEGKSPWYWLDQVGYEYTYAGENLAVNFDDSSEVEEAWMNSPTHRANIVKPQYTRVGYAVAKGIYKGEETVFVVQEFAAKPMDQTVTKEARTENPIAVAVREVVPGDKETADTEPETIAPEETDAVAQEQERTDSDEASSDSAGESADAAQDSTVSTTTVLGVQTGETYAREPTALQFFKRLAASPLHTSVYALGGLAGILLVLLIFALFAHARVRYLEVLSGGLIVIAFALSVLAFNATHALDPVLPQSAAAVEAAAP